MPIQKFQIRRLKRIAALLKENRYPNSESLVADFRKIAIEEGVQIECSRKTILRDMKTLERDFKCPLDFDRGRNGYYLLHHGWDFISPAMLDENEMLAAVIGARISEDIFPPPLRNRIRDAVDELLQQNNPDFLDTANIGSLKILSGLYAKLDPNVFLTVFEGWQKHREVKISYADSKGIVTERIFDPQTLVFFRDAWYSKGYCHLKKQPRTFALHRIRSAELLSGRFEEDEKIVRSVNMDDFLGFKRIKNVRIKLKNNFMIEQAQGHPLHSGQTIDREGILFIPGVSREILFPWLLSAEGNAVLLEPDELKKEFSELLNNMAKAYQ